MKNHKIMSKVIVVLILTSLTSNLLASSWYSPSSWMPNRETFTNWMPSSPQWVNQLASGWASLSPIQQRAALATVLGLGVGGGYYGWNQRQQRLAAEAQRLYQEREAESANIRNSILNSLAFYIEELENAPPSTIKELKRVTDAINTIEVELIQPKLSLLTSDDQQAIKLEMNKLIYAIENQKRRIAERELMQRSQEEMQRRADEEMKRLAEEGLREVNQQLEALEKEREQEELEKIKGKEEAEYFINEQVQEKVNEYDQAISQLKSILQQHPGNEEAKRHVYTKLSELIESINNDRLVKTNPSQQERLINTAQWIQNGIYPQEGQPAPSSLPSSSSSSSSSYYQASAEQRSIPIITVQNMYGSPLEIGVKFKNGTVTKKLDPIGNNKNLTLETNLNVAEMYQNLAQPTDVTQHGDFTDLTLTREPAFITYRSPGTSLYGSSYTTYGVDIRKYLNDKDIKTIVIKIPYNNNPTVIVTSNDNSTQTAEEQRLTSF